MKEFCYIYGSILGKDYGDKKVSEIEKGFLVIAIVFNESDLYKFSNYTSKIYTGFKGPRIREMYLPPLVKILKESKELKIYYRYKDRTTYSLEGAALCFYNFLKEMEERKVAEHLIVCSTLPLIEHIYMANTIFFSTELVYKSPYLKAAFVMWAYYQNIFKAKK